MEAIRPTVLVINDQENIRKLLNLALETCGYLVHEAGHGQAALDCLESCPVDLILTDWFMPVMNGREFLEKFQKRNKGLKIPVIVFSSSACSGDMSDLERFGVDCWLTAPCRISTIQQAVAELLAIYAGHEEIEMKHVSIR